MSTAPAQTRIPRARPSSGRGHARLRPGGHAAHDVRRGRARCADRFGISPATLSAFVFLQVAVYIAAQLPGGLLVDRWGARTVLVLGSALLASGQVLLAFAPGPSVRRPGPRGGGRGRRRAVHGGPGARPRCFPPAASPNPAADGTLGQIGRTLSAVPFLALLHAQGWSTAFGAAAAAACWPRPDPGRRAERAARDVASRAAVPARRSPARSATCGGGPGTRLGFFGHMGTQFSMMVLSLLWGVPYLMSAQGLSSGRGRRPGHPLRGVRDPHRPGHRRPDGTAPAAPVLAGPGHRRRGRRPCGRSCSPCPGPAPRGLLVLLVVVLAAADRGRWSGSTSPARPTRARTSASPRASSTWAASSPACWSSPRWAPSWRRSAVSPLMPSGSPGSSSTRSGCSPSSGSWSPGGRPPDRRRPWRGAAPDPRGACGAGLRRR